MCGGPDCQQACAVVDRHFVSFKILFMSRANANVLRTQCARTSWCCARSWIKPYRRIKACSARASRLLMRARKKERGHPVRSRARTTQAFQQRTPLGRDSSAPLSTCRVIRSRIRDVHVMLLALHRDVLLSRSHHLPAGTPCCASRRARILSHRHGRAHRGRCRRRIEQEAGPASTQLLGDHLSRRGDSDGPRCWHFLRWRGWVRGQCQSRTTPGHLPRRRLLLLL